MVELETPDVIWLHAYVHNFQHSWAKKQTEKKALTFKSQVAKESCQKVHNVHDKDGDVGHFLHSRLRWAVMKKLRNCHILHGCADKYRRPTRADSLPELGVDGEDLWVAHEGESEDGNSVRCLRGAQKHR